MNNKVILLKLYVACCLLTLSLSARAGFLDGIESFFSGAKKKGADPCAWLEKKYPDKLKPTKEKTSFMLWGAFQVDFHKAREKKCNGLWLKTRKDICNSNTLIFEKEIRTCLANAEGAPAVVAEPAVKKPAPQALPPVPKPAEQVPPPQLPKDKEPVVVEAPPVIATPQKPPALVTPPTPPVVATPPTETKLVALNFNQWLDSHPHREENKFRPRQPTLIEAKDHDAPYYYSDYVKTLKLDNVLSFREWLNKNPYYYTEEEERRGLDWETVITPTSGAGQAYGLYVQEVAKK